MIYRFGDIKDGEALILSDNSIFEYWYEGTLLKLRDGLTKLIGDKELTTPEDGFVSMDDGFLPLLGV